MKNTYKRIILMMLVISTLLCTTVRVFAAEESEEIYLSDLRIVYADDYDEAREILDETEFAEYNLLKANLNENTGKTGVYLAFKITTDIEDAITDIAVMQMNGGYNEGNYQEMIKQSYNEYLEFGENYLVAIEYFNTGYDAGHYLSEIAYRQLNFYNVVTEGIDEIPEYEGELLGDIFFSGIDASDLATMFMEGNSYALSNIRSLIAMGVSYNEDGKTYFEKVADEAAKYTADNNIYDGENYDEAATMVSASLSVFRDMFRELESYESELNYLDEELTELELNYLNQMALASLMRSVDYLNGKTLYRFIMEYQGVNVDYSELYPLVAALNEGQLAMTKVAHYYDVVRYSITLADNSDINAQLDELESKYGENPFNVYEGVDRTIYDGTFALTSDAYRADAFTESGVSALIFKSGYYEAEITIGIIGASITAAGIGTHVFSYLYPQRCLKLYNQLLEVKKIDFGYTIVKSGPYSGLSASDAMDNIFNKAVTDKAVLDQANKEVWSFTEKYNYIANNNLWKNGQNPVEGWTHLESDFSNYVRSDADFMYSNKVANKVVDRANSITNLAYGAYVVGGIMMLASAIKIGIGIWNYYHPEYTDIPTAMVDLIDTVDGDRYIKYDVVYEAEESNDGGYAAADLNAFSAARWNALYYTKSYEAGKPLLADEFIVSTNNNTPSQKYAPVHRFGEVVCYNLNKYNFNDDHTIYLSVKQSDNQKYASSGAPELVGSIISTTDAALIGGIGALGGAAVSTVSTLIAKKKH